MVEILHALDYSRAAYSFLVATATTSRHHYILLQIFSKKNSPALYELLTSGPEAT